MGSDPLITQSQHLLNVHGRFDIKSEIFQSSSDEYKSVPRASLRENMETREWAHRSLLLIFKVRRRTDSGVSHQPLNEMCENLWLSHKAGGSFCHTPNGMLKGQSKSIQPTENNGAWPFYLFHIPLLYKIIKHFQIQFNMYCPGKIYVWFMVWTKEHIIQIYSVTKSEFSFVSETYTP